MAWIKSIPIHHYRAFSETCCIHIAKKEKKKWSAKLGKERILVILEKTDIVMISVYFVVDKETECSEVKKEPVY